MMFQDILWLYLIMVMVACGCFSADKISQFWLFLITFGDAGFVIIVVPILVAIKLKTKLSHIWTDNVVLPEKILIKK